MADTSASRYRLEFAFTALWWLLGTLSSIASVTFIAVEMYYKPTQDQRRDSTHRTSLVQQVHIEVSFSRAVESENSSGHAREQRVKA